MKTLYQYLEGCKGQTKYLLTEDEYQEYRSLKIDADNGIFVSDDEYVEYLSLKQFKKDYDKDIEEWDKGIDIRQTLRDAGYKESTKDCFYKGTVGITTNIKLDPETTEDILQDELGGIRTFIKDQKLFNKVIVKLIK